jgi:hypothetical protein
MSVSDLFGKHIKGKATPALLVLACFVISAGCVQLKKPLDPIDPGMYASGASYKYQPLNPTTVWIRDPSHWEILQGYMDADETSYEFNKALLRDLDTETVRISLNRMDWDVSLKSTVVGASQRGESYVLVVDYIKYITSKKEVEVKYDILDCDKEVFTMFFNGTVPMYTGIGMRVRAEFKANKTGLDISGLPALAVAANTNGISGSLTVQTLGITGSEVTALMPIISDISVTSIQSAVQAVAAIKAKIYERSTNVSPKIVGFESPGSSPGLIRAITEYMYSTHEWICPNIINHPQYPDDPEKNIYWIDWFSPPMPGDEDWSRDTMLDAAYRGNGEIVTVLLDSGVDINAADDHDNTALILAAAEGNEEVVGILLKRGADLNAKNCKGKTAMDAAVKWGYEGVVKMLSGH